MSTTDTDASTTDSNAEAEPALHFMEASATSSKAVAKFRDKVRAARGTRKKDPNAVAAAAARSRQRANSSDLGADARERVNRKTARESEPPTPLELEQAAVTALREQRARARTDGGGNGGDARARALRREVSRRLKQRALAEETERLSGRSAARVAIVGAGPVGLWLAVLLARKHATFTNGPNGPCISRNRSAPTIDVFERREPAGGRGRSSGGSTNSRAHGGRSIVLAITNATSDLLNRQLLGPTADNCASHAFAPTSRIGEIEQIFAAEFERYAAAGFGRLHYGADVPDPDELHTEARCEAGLGPCPTAAAVLCSGPDLAPTPRLRLPSPLLHPSSLLPSPLLLPSSLLVLTRLWFEPRGGEGGVRRRLHRVG